MTIPINDRVKIADIQKEFNQEFPFLKIEFAGKNSDGTVATHRTVRNSGVLAISSNMTVTDLENYFQRVFGLQVQIFRKSGKAWIETSVTDSWTLEQQNREGQALSK